MRQVTPKNSSAFRVRSDYLIYNEMVGGVKATKMVTIILELDQDVERKARDAGLLSSETITAWIEAELQRNREESRKQLAEMMDEASASFRARYPDMTDDAFIEMLNDETSPIREQQRIEAIAKTRDILDQLDALEPQLTEEEIEAELRKPSVSV